MVVPRSTNLLVFLLCATWYLPGVIALRYLIAFLLLVLVLIAGRRQASTAFFELWVLGLFLLVFLLYDANFLLSLEAIRGEWGKNLLFAFIGFSLVELKNSKSSSHLFIFRFAAFGFLTPIFIYSVIVVNIVIRGGYVPMGI